MTAMDAAEQKLFQEAKAVLEGKRGRRSLADQWAALGLYATVLARAYGWSDDSPRIKRDTKSTG